MLGDKPVEMHKGPMVVEEQDILRLLAGDLERETGRQTEIQPIFYFDVSGMRSLYFNVH